MNNIIPLVVCVNMSDYLNITIDKNRHFFEKYYVLTCDNDVETQTLCEEYNADVIKYNEFFDKNGCKFNKSGGIFMAQKYLHEKYPNHWILLLDVDIVLMEETFTILKDTILKDTILNDTELNENALYGVKRYDVLNDEELLNKYKKRLYRSDFVGFFQLYYNKNIYYPEFSKNASVCDLVFLQKFKKKIMLNGYVFHLGNPGAHWNGKSIDCNFKKNL